MKVGPPWDEIEEIINKASNKASNEALNANKAKKEALNEAGILSVIKEKPYISQKQLADELGISRSNVQRIMKKMMEKGMIKRIGARKKGEWKIL